MNLTLNRTIAVLTLRLILGFLFFFQGYGKVFKFGVDNVYNNFFKETFNPLLPDLLVLSTAYYTSYIELIAGFLLVIGFKRDYALYALASVLIIVTFGHGLAEPIWDTSNVMSRTILLIPLLLLPKAWDRFSIDAMLHKKSS